MVGSEQFDAGPVQEENLIKRVISRGKMLKREMGGGAHVFSLTSRTKPAHLSF